MNGTVESNLVVSSSSNDGIFYSLLCHKINSILVSTLLCQSTITQPPANAISTFTFCLTGLTWELCFVAEPILFVLQIALQSSCVAAAVGGLCLLRIETSTVRNQSDLVCPGACAATAIHVRVEATVGTTPAW